jgi:hypothetical protein
MANNNRLTKGEASVGALVVDDFIRFNDATEQVTAYKTAGYLSAYSSETQTNVGGGTAVNTFSYTNVTTRDSITLVDNTKLTVLKNGAYNIQFSAQVDKTDSGSDNIDIWLATNGTAVADSNTRITVPTNNGKVVAAWNWVVDAIPSHYFEIQWYSLDNSMRLYAEGQQSNPLRPAIPSVIVTVTEI